MPTHTLRRAFSIAALAFSLPFASSAAPIGEWHAFWRSLWANLGLNVDFEGRPTESGGGSGPFVRSWFDELGLGVDPDGVPAPAGTGSSVGPGVDPSAN